MQTKTLSVVVLLAVLAWSAVTEACELYRDEVHDRAGSVIASATIAVTLAGTIVPVTVYNGPDCLTALGTSVTSDSSGIFQFYAHDGLYDLTTTRTGYSFAVVQNLRIFAPVVEYVIPLATYTTTDLAAASTGAIAVIGSTITTLLINQAATASLSFTCPSTLTILFQGQGTLTLAAAKTAVLNCRIINLTDHAILLGTGTYTKTATSLGHRLESVTNSQLDAASDGTIVYCTDCTQGSGTCAAASTGARATRINGSWRCD